MNISVFVTIWLAATSSVDLDQHFRAGPLAYLSSLADVSAVEMYSPINKDAPKTPGKADVTPPTLLLEIQLDSAAKAKALVETGAFKEHFLTKSGKLAEADKITLDLLEAVHFDIPGHASPPQRTAPFSFVVRYYGPVKNAAEFTEYYTSTHPPLLAQFPGVRNVLCYLPLGWRDRGELLDGTLIHGNEVVFDSFDAFKASTQSAAMQAVRENAGRFAEFGYTSHHPTIRERIYAR